ncbi:MAG TPA: hypothetical protein VGM81_02145 [Burkholderiaceae bacterium]|jgi:hypothetical protein
MSITDIKVQRAGFLERIAVCYQDVPDDLLPLALKAANPLGIPRLVDGELQIGI